MDDAAECFVSQKSIISQSIMNIKWIININVALLLGILDTEMFLF